MTVCPRVATKTMKYNDPQSLHIASPRNIYKCYRQCRRRKRRTINALNFELNLEQNILDIREQLLNGTYRPRSAQAFIVQKPKQREIFAADFYDRVVHHILVAQLEPLWERRFIYDSYACRRGKGSLAAVKRLQQFSRQATSNGVRQAWYMQLDIQSYFTAMNRHILYKLLKDTLQHPLLDELAHTIIYQDVTKDCHIKQASRADFLALPARKTLFKAPPHKGLPIGSLTSQFFGNVYLNALDQFIKHELKVRWYVRYCDDFVLLADSPQQLEDWRWRIVAFVSRELDLTVRRDYKLAQVSSGIDFLGYIVRPSHLLPRQRVVAALEARLHAAERALYRAGYYASTSGSACYPYNWLMLRQLRSTLNSYQGHLKHAAARRQWSRLKVRYEWLDAYFDFSTAHSGVAFRYPPPKPSVTYGRQIAVAQHQFKGYTALLQLGSWWQVFAPDGSLPDKYIHASSIARYGRWLQRQGQRVVYYGETGQVITGINDRQLSRILLPAGHKIGTGEQLTLF